MSRVRLTSVLRLLIGAILVGSALGKSLSVPGFVEVLATYRVFPEWMLWPFSLLITGLEWALGAWILWGYRLQQSALAAIGLNLCYAFSMTVTLFRGLELANCGCFGVYFPRPLRWYSPIEDLIMAGMCYALWRHAKKYPYPIDTIS